MNKVLIELCRRIASGQIEYPQEPPLFDWQAQLDDAEYIIAEIKKPVPPRIGSRRRKPSPGLDLGRHRDSLARFLADLREGYALACLDYEMRTKPDKPHREFEKNWRDDEPDPGYDYGANAGQGLDFDWDEFWVETYGRGAGNSGGNRTATKRSDKRPPVEPLRLNYPAIVQWWKDATEGGFSPEFAKPSNAHEAGEPFERNNPSARFLILVVQCLNDRFDAANARGLPDTVKRQRRKIQKKIAE